MNDRERTTMPETPRAKVVETSPFREVIVNILSRYRSYQLPPGGSITMNIGAERFKDPREHIGFGIIPGMIFPGKTLKDSLLVVGFLDWKDLEHSQAQIRYFCGVFPDGASEERRKDIGEELLLGRQNAVFNAFRGNNNISKQHARIRTRKNGTGYQIEILDGVPEHPSSYGSTVLVNPDITISQTGGVRPIQLCQGPPEGSRSLFLKE